MQPVSISYPPDESLRAVCEAMWAVESELDLFAMEVGGVRLWRPLRWEVCRALMRALGRATSTEAPSSDLPRRVLHEVEALRKRVMMPSWRSAGDVDTVLVPFPRKQTSGAAPVDFLSKSVLDEPGLGRILVLERTDANRHTLAGDRVFVANRDRDRQEAIARALVSFPLLLQPLAPIHRAIDDGFQRRLGLPLPISLASMALRIALFDESRKIFRRMLRATRAKRFLAAWTDLAMFAAAHDNGMETVELQHAAFSKYNPHFHFPRGGEIPYFARTFLVFAPYWSDRVTLPDNTRARVLGSLNMAMLRERAATRHARRVIIPSQGPTHWPLLDSTLEAAAKSPDWEFIFRPHPRENFDAYKVRLATRHVSDNFRLSGPEEDFYRLVTTAAVQIGLASTTLFEGMSLGCRTIVFQSPMSPAMEDVLARGDAVSARNGDEIVSSLTTAPAARRPDLYYAAPAPILEAIGATPQSTGERP